MAFALRDQATTANHMIEKLERKLEENPRVNAKGVGMDLGYRMFSKSKKANLASFVGLSTQTKLMNE